MPSDKDLFQNFSEFKGLDVQSSDLSRPLTNAKEVKNFIIEQNFSLGGEKGLHLYANGDNSTGSTFFIGTHNYIYKDLDTGMEVEELIAIGPKISTIGSGLYRLKEGSLDITYSGSSTFGYQFLYNTATSKLKLALIEGGTEVSSYSSVSGLEDDATTPLSLTTVASTFNAVAGFSASITGDGDAFAGCLALVDVSGLSSGSASIPFHYWEEVAQGTEQPHGGSAFGGAVFNHNKIVKKHPIFINKNNCCYIVCDGECPLMKYDGVNVRQAGLFTVFKDDITVTAAASGTPLVGSYRYYLRYVSRDARGNYIYGAGAYSEIIEALSGEAPSLDIFSATGWQGPGFLISLGVDTTTSSPGNTATLSAPLTEDLLKSRGFEGLMPGDLIRILQGTTAANRKVMSVDRGSNQITFDGEPFSFTPNTNVYWANAAFTTESYIGTNAAQSNVSTIATTLAKGVEVGTWLFFPDEQEWFQVTAISGGNVTINGVVSIPSGSHYITSTALQVWRTLNGGFDKLYLSQELSSMDTFSAATFGSSFLDTTSDGNLGEELILPNHEPDILLGCPSNLVQHQGVMIIAGGTLRAGRLYYEDFQYIEGFPAATNFYDVPSQDAGVITALWSDTYDQLAVFKETAYYSIVGSFRDDIVVLSTIANTEEDLGISAQTSLVKIRGLNIGIGKLGFVAFKGGQIDYEFTKQLSPEFLSSSFGEVFTDSQRIRTGRAVAVNDRFKQQAYFLVPVYNVSGDAHTGASDLSRIYILDYSERTWSRRTFPSDLSISSSGLLAYPFMPSSGMVVYKDSLFLHSCAYDSTKGGGDYTDFSSLLFKRKERQVLPSGIGDYRHDYYDQHDSIPYEYKTQWFFGDSPSVDRFYHWLKIYSLSSPDFVPFSLRVRTYIDWDEATAIDDVTLSFTSQTPSHLIKLNANRAESLLIRFTTNAVMEKPTITGFELITGEYDDNIEGVR